MPVVASVGWRGKGSVTEEFCLLHVDEEGGDGRGDDRNCRDKAIPLRTQKKTSCMRMILSSSFGRSKEGSWR